MNKKFDSMHPLLLCALFLSIMICSCDLVNRGDSEPLYLDPGQPALRRVGEFLVMIGASCQDIRLRGNFEVAAENR